MKSQILAGSLGLVLLLSLVPLPQAEAKTFIIDDFESEPNQLCDIGPTDLAGPFGPFVQAVASGVLGGFRECTFFLDLTNTGSNGALSVVPAPSGMLRMETAALVESQSTLRYDGTAAAGGAALGVNFADSDTIRLVFSSGDFAIATSITLTDSSGPTSVTITKNSPTLIVVDQELHFPLTEFTDANAALDLSDIQSIVVFFDTTTAPLGNSDFTVEIIDVTMQMVGGEMFPVDTTALLLAGVELNAMWILPAIAAIGIGAFVVSRKRN